MKMKDCKERRGVEASIKQRMDACLLMSYKFRGEMEAK